MNLNKFFNSNAHIKSNKFLLPCFILFFLYFMLYNSVEITIPLTFTDLKISGSVLGGLYAVTKLVRSILVVPVSMINRKYKMNFLIITMLTNIFLILLFILTKNKIVLILTFAFLLITTSIFNVILNPLMAINTPKDKIGITFGIRDVFLYLGGLVGLIITGKLSSIYMNIDSIFIFYIVTIIIISFFMYRLKKYTINDIPNQDAEKNIEKTKKEKIKLINIEKSFLLFLLINSILIIGNSYLGFIVIFGSKLGISNNNIYYYFSASTTVSAILSLVGGILIDKYNKKLTYIVDIFITLFILILLSSGQQSLYLIGIVVMSIGTLFNNSTNAYLFSAFSEKHVEKYWGIISSTSLISASIGSLIFGFMLDLNYKLIFPSSILINLIGLLLSFKLPNVKKGDL